MVNSWLLLSGIGMMLIAVIPTIWWWRSKKVPVKYFAFGAVIWVIAILPKLLMDLTITPSLNNYLVGYGTEIVVIVSGIYVGLRTGLFESGFAYIAGIKTKLRNVSFNQAIAFGLGFGGLEAFFIGFASFINILAFLIMPDLVNQLSETQQEIVLEQLNQSIWAVPAPIMERGFVILIHVFAALLVFYAIKKAQNRYLGYSIAYKTAVDGIIPALTTYIGLQTLSGIYAIEIVVAVFGIFGIFGIVWIREKWGE